MIQIHSNTCCKQLCEPVQITDNNKAEIIEGFSKRYKQSFLKKSLTYSKTYEMVKLLVQGIFQRDLVHEVMEHISSDWKLIQFLKDYIKEAADVFSDGYEEEEYQFHDFEQEYYDNQQQKNSFSQLESQSRCSQMKFLGDELSVFSQDIFLNQRVSEQLIKQHHYNRSLSINHQMSFSVNHKDEQNLSSIFQPMCNSDISTNSSQSLAQSWLITHKSKQLIILPTEDKPERVDYKKQYQKRVNNALTKNALTIYKKRR